MAQILKATGILKTNGEIYAILSGLPPMPEEVFQEVANYNLPTFRVVKRFFIEATTKDEITGEDLYVTPRWLSASCPYTIEWFDQPQDVKVLVKDEETKKTISEG